MIDDKYGEIIEGRLMGCRFAPSPNCSARPAQVEVALLVIHNISLPPGQFGGEHIEALFTNNLDPTSHPYFAGIASLEVSAHFLVQRDGNVIQFVATEQCAWHAGVSNWRGRDKCNDFSIGIELEGTDTHVYTDVQYQRLVELVEKCRRAYPTIEPHAIVGHSDIAPGRKTDPGDSFDWARLSNGLGVEDLPGR